MAITWEYKRVTFIGVFEMTCSRGKAKRVFCKKNGVQHEGISKNTALSAHFAFMRAADKCRIFALIVRSKLLTNPKCTIFQLSASCDRYLEQKLIIGWGKSFQLFGNFPLRSYETFKRQDCLSIGLYRQELSNKDLSLVFGFVDVWSLEF